MLNWMYWTLPTALFFIGIAIMLGVFTVLQFAYPTVERKGFMPFATTRGDRLFMGLLGSGYIHLAWLALTEGAPLWIASIIALAFLAIMLRWG